MHSLSAPTSPGRGPAFDRDPDDDPETLQDEMGMGGKERERKLRWKLGLSFFLFGLINNVLYVIILSAALDLVPPSTPKGIIAFFNIAPALAAKVGWPYLLKGRIRYVKRLIGCCLLSSFGMIVVAMFDSLFMRLVGIGLASFSSGLGELTFLQLSTTYAPPSIAGHSVGYFASGTGAAGLVGAFIWWEVRSLGVRVGVGLSSIMPFIIPLTYFYLLPHNSAFLSLSPADDEESTSPSGDSSLPYTPLPSAEDQDGEEEGSLPPGPRKGVSLSPSDKWRLVKPLLLKYMLPLFCVYLFEYTINQGIAPTLLYPVPSAEEHPILSKIIHSIRDYYPLWQLVYQTTVFFSRSSISIGLPPLPARLLSLPAFVQAAILLSLAFESAVGFFPTESNGLSIMLVFFLVSLEGVCGGLAYVNVFFRINQERPDPHSAHDIERTKQEKEFKIGSIGFADSSGILFASLFAVPTELELCKAQVRRGKMFCKGL
ncbi:batten's disease protein Cln3 [Collybia nuda]|uniref:Protein BTN n=1 Tax=Collybia nuda TaxID=64659 RepID=A0A9P5Y4Q8_9AGAR|nr:batten's disease protein Cln3 [Collybia nuda]